MGLITWAKKVIGMIFKRQAEEDFNVESVVSPEMESKITECANIYRGTPYWVYSVLFFVRTSAQYLHFLRICFLLCYLKHRIFLLWHDSFQIPHNQLLFSFSVYLLIWKPRSPPLILCASHDIIVLY